MSCRTRPEGHPIIESPEITAPLRESPSIERRKTSMSFVVALSIIFGLIIASGTILGVVGKAFYVSREEYTAQSLNNAESKTSMKQTLERIDRTLTRQEASFEKLSEAVQGIKVEMAGKKAYSSR
jgi:uncharacterized protein HemX